MSEGQILGPQPAFECGLCDGLGSWHVHRGSSPGTHPDNRIPDEECTRRYCEGGGEPIECDKCHGAGFEACFFCAELATTDRSGEKTCEHHAEHCDVCDRELDEDGECLPCRAKMKFGVRP